MDRVTAWERAATSLEITPTPRPRPTLLRQLGVVVWVPVPERCRLWVLYDATCSTWIVRYLLRTLVRTIPPALTLALLLPTAVWLRVLTALVTALWAFMVTAIWINESTDSRLARMGWSAESARVLRQRRAQFARRF